MFFIDALRRVFACINTLLATSGRCLPPRERAWKL